MENLNAERFIEIFPFFKNSSESLINEILSLSRYNFSSRNNNLQLEGHLCSHLELMISGEKRIYKSSPTGREITLYEVGSGEACIINAVCSLTESPSPASSRAITDTTSLLIPSTDFRNLVAKHEDVRSFVFSSIDNRLISFLQLLAEVVFERTDKRLFDYLIEKSEDGILLTTHQQIANDLGTAREVISRLLEDFASKGKVILSRGRIELNSFDLEDF